MFVTVISGIIVAVCLVSSLIFYVFMRTQNHRRSSSTSSINEKQQIKYSFRPSIDIITKKLSQDFTFRPSLSTSKSHQSSTTNLPDEENLSMSKKKEHQSDDSIHFPGTTTRSTSVGTNIYPMRRPRSANWRQGSIVDSNQMALIQFSLPPNHQDKSQFRRRSVPIFSDLIQTTKLHSTIQNDLSSTLLLSFSIIYSKTSQLQIQFHSLTGVPSTIHLQHLTIKIKILPEGKEKSVQIRKLSNKENLLANETNEYFIEFSHIPFEKLHERNFLITVHGKDQAKKNVHLGQIGKILFNQFNPIKEDYRLEFLQEIEKVKPSSIEILVGLEKKNEYFLHVDLQRIKGLKVDQKNHEAKYYLRVVLLDRHRPLISQQTKSHRLNASTFTLAENYDLNIFTYNSTNFDRLMLIISLYTNGHHSNDYQCLARIKLGSPLFCSGSGTIHWQQFKARESFSMWHTLNKYQPVENK